MKLDVKAFAWACAIIWGAGLPLLTWWMIAIAGPTVEPTWLGRIYVGYNLTFVGSLIGAAWAFFDGLIGGLIFATVYNWIEERVHHVHRVA
jgi:hypothetical protein